jgi:hypothetical protein
MSKTDREIEIVLSVLIAVLIAVLLWIGTRPAGVCH